MARKSRRKRTGGGYAKPLLIGVGILALIGVGMLVFKNGSAKASGEPKAFDVAKYRRDGSRFASTGNRYVLEGEVRSIETHGDSRMVAVALKDNDHELLPLLVPGGVKLGTNLTRGDVFIFDVSCRTGRGSDGQEVRGVLVVNQVESK